MQHFHEFLRRELGDVGDTKNLPANHPTGHQLIEQQLRRRRA